MALGFNSAPVNWDFSNILLSNQSGARIGAGLSQMGQGLAAGIEGWAQRKRQEENIRRAEEEAKRQRAAIDQRAKGLLGLAKTAPELFGGPEQARALIDEVSATDMPAEARYGRLQGELDAAAARRELERWNLQQEQQRQRAEMEAQSQAALRAAMVPRPTQGPLRADVLDANQAWNSAPVSERYMQTVAAGAPLDPGIMEITSKLDSARAAGNKPKPGQLLDVDGTRMVWTGAQYEQLRKGDPDRALFQDGPRIIERDGTKFYQVGPQHEPKPLREDSPRLNAQDSATLNSAYVTLQRATDRIAELQTEKEKNGDSKWFGPNLSELIEEERKNIRTAQATIDRFENRPQSKASNKTVDWDKVW